ncbi:hypothetical protein Tco_1125761 [Tanacetum coccineum]
MDSSSNIYGDATEDCQSSESGWTMYIGSYMDDDDGDDDGGGGGGVYDASGTKKKGTIKDEDDDTDDSMTSDASSGPSHLHLQQPWNVQENEKQEKHKSSSKKNKKASGKKKTGYDQQESRKKDDEKRGVIATLQSGPKSRSMLHEPSDDTSIIRHVYWPIGY